MPPTNSSVVANRTGYQSILRLQVAIREDASSYTETFSEGVISAASRWHKKFDELHAAAKLSDRQLDALHALAASTANDIALMSNSNPKRDDGTDEGWGQFHRIMQAKIKTGVDELTTAFEEYISRTPVKLDIEKHWRTIGPKSLFAADAVLQGDVITTDFSVTDTCIAYGPYLSLPAGHYRATFYFNYNAPISTSNCLIGIDVAANGEALSRSQINAQSLLKGHEIISVMFKHTASEDLLEFRVFINGKPMKGKLTFLGIGIDRE